MAYHPNPQNPRPSTTLNRVEPETLKVGDSDRLFYEEPAPAAEAVQGTGSASWPTSPAMPKEWTFKLHSRRSAFKKIYLDFTGHDTYKSEWNESYGKVKSAPWNLSGNVDTYTTAEHAFIQNVYQAVADDFSVFDVDVTTEEPGPYELIRWCQAVPTDALGRPLPLNNLDPELRCDNAQQKYGIRVVISPTTSWYPKRRGGVSYVGSFLWGSTSENPAFVFADASDSAKFVAEVASHEVGHTLALKHDGHKNAAGETEEYYHGHGDWAPIMGSGYDEPVTQWSKGEYVGATNKQDDIAVLAAVLGRLPDDYANTPQDWLAGIKIPGIELQQSGRIEKAGDIDVRLVCMYASTNIKVLPTNNGRVAGNVNLSAKLSLSGKPKLMSSPSTSLEAELNVTTPGCYHLQVEGVGYGSNASTGYTNYGSIGAYTIVMK